MQPALTEVVQNSTLPASAATTGVFFVATRSLPWCGPPARGWPKSSMYVAGPATGKISVGTLFAPAAEPGTARPSRSSRRRTPRAVVRWRRIKLRFALEGADPSSRNGETRGRNCRLRAVIGNLMRFRGLALAGVIAAAWAAAGTAGASLNPQHAG